MHLATIKKIKNIYPIDGADKIEMAELNGKGWNVVVEKGKYKPNDLVIFIEPDSWIPHEIAPFLSKSEPKMYNGIKGNRLKPIKIKGVKSMGLILPISILKREVKENEDVTNELGIIKWEKPIDIELRGEIEEAFPYFIPKTDEINIQSKPELLDEFKKIECNVYITEKIDGTSATFYFYEDKFKACSRNLVIKPGNNIYWEIAKRYKLNEKLKDLKKELAIQGEIYGEKIQNNPLGIKGIDFAVFDIFDISQQKYMEFKEMKNICEYLGLKMVPLIYYGYFEKNWDIPYLISMARGFYSNANSQREGIVIRPEIYIYSQTIKRKLSIKVLNPDYED